MKKKILLSFLSLVLCVPAAVLLSGSVPLPVQKDASALLSDGERKAIARGLYGRIELVIGGLADSPGRWEIVKGLPDFRVYITNSVAEADLLICFVNSNPGPVR